MDVVVYIFLFALGVVIGGVFVWIRRGADVKVLSDQVDHYKERVDEYRQSLENERTLHENERTYMRAQIDENNKQWNTKLDAVKQELLHASAEALSQKQSSLQETNRTQISQLLSPIQEKFAEFQKSVELSRTSSEVNKKSIQDTFEATLKLFQQQQQQAVERMVNATERIGDEANNLTKALKSDSKKQGNWGEMVLESILANCGLTRDIEYFVQQSYKDKNNRTAYPDVVVKFPEGKCVVIDSKVSLTSYVEAVSTDDDIRRNQLLNDHVKSVRRHIDELVERDYSSIVDDAIGFVLMFVPNESAYIAAVKQEPGLSNEAYQKRIIIISPSNLLMALQLAHNLWQYDRQNKNVEKIINAAADLYDKVVGFEDAFSEIDSRMSQLREAYETAKGRLYTGRGSIMSRVDSLKELGVSPKKRLKGTNTND